MKLNLKAIRKRCERWKWFKTSDPEDYRHLEKDEWYGPIEEMSLACFAIHRDLPALLDWVERAKALMTELFDTCDGSDPKCEWCRLTKLLAELNDNGD